MASKISVAIRSAAGRSILASARALVSDSRSVIATRSPLPAFGAARRRLPRRWMFRSVAQGRRSLQRGDEAGEEGQAVGAAEQRVGGVLGVRHQPQDRAAVVEDAGDGA